MNNMLDTVRRQLREIGLDIVTSYTSEETLYELTDGNLYSVKQIQNLIK